MSSILRVSYIVEGATDFLVLDALVERFLGTNNYVPIQIQPPVSEFADHQGPLGGGWKGVLQWCKNSGSSPEGFAGSAALLNVDYMIIHVDADIAQEVELQAYNLSASCPPAKETCDNIRNHLVSLLGDPLPPKVVLCVPAQCIEAWIFAALHPNEVVKYDPIECRADVSMLLIGKTDRLVRKKNGSAKKQTGRYKETAPRIAQHWATATGSCPEARRFETEFTAAVGKTP